MLSLSLPFARACVFSLKLEGLLIISMIVIDKEYTNVFQIRKKCR